MPYDDAFLLAYVVWTDDQPHSLRSYAAIVSFRLEQTAKIAVKRTEWHRVLKTRKMMKKGVALLVTLEG